MYNGRMINREFKREYARLNAEQKRAVDAIEGPVMVVAGPGTGKTQVLTLRMANILARTDTAPENILALTFTDAAAVNMRRRLASVIGAAAYRVRIETFHSFCNNILNSYPESFPGIIGSAHISEVETAGIIEEILDGMAGSILKPWGDPLFYVKDIIKNIEELKREGVTPEKFQKMTSQAGSEKKREIEKNMELAVIYKKYRQILDKRRLYDWSDMIMEVLKKLKAKSLELKEKTNELKQILQEEHQYILVDEHQDTNNAQNEIIEILCDFHKNPNIFVVGDEKQAIFRFQGASVENFLYFKKLYPRAKLIELWHNYRSGQDILDGAHSIIPTKQKLESKIKKGSIKIAEFSNYNFENNWIAQKIEKNAGETAIIYRNNKDAFPIAAALERRNIAYEIRSDEDLFGDKFVRKFISILDCLYHYGEDAYLITVLHMEESGIDPLEVYKIISKANKERKNIYDLLGKHEISKKLKKWRLLSHEEEVTKFMEIILRESGLLDTMLSAKDAAAFLGIEKIMDEAKRISINRPDARLSDFMKYLDALRAHKIFIKRPKSHFRENRVQLMTAHRAKGLEFENIFITGASEKAFGPKNRPRKLPLLAEVYRKSGMPALENESDEDERRLFYVAVTRAKSQVFITYSNQDENGKEILRSPYIDEIRKNKIEIIDTKKYEEEVMAKPEKLFLERKDSGAKEIDEEFVLELWKSHPLSVTALNNYLDCPWKYFYRNLLRIPQVPERYLLYGTAMHGAVDDMYKSLKNREADEKYLLNAYKRRLGNLGLGLNEEKVYWEKGKKALSGWFRWAKPQKWGPVISEFSTTVSLGKNIMLAGKIDKIEFLEGSKVSVTDFKTGKQKSRNEIGGLTKNSKGDMKRQLVFYKLLLDLHPTSHKAPRDKWDMKEGIIEFLEPDQQGRYKREVFEIGEGEVEKLKETIQKVADEITNLKFWSKTCDDKNCEYCAYRKLLR